MTIPLPTESHESGPVGHGPVAEAAPDEFAELLPQTRRALLHRLAVGQAEGRAPSLTGAVVRGGRVVWTGSQGSVEGEAPHDDVQYRIGSLTKTFVAVLVLRLRDEGLLRLEDPVGRHLDGSPVPEATIAQLLAHSSGLAAETRGPWWERTAGELRPEQADLFDERPQRLPAGRRHHYSNPGYALLGALVERLRGGSPWDEVLRNEVLEPLGMGRTTLRPERPHASGWAVHPWADAAAAGAGRGHRLDGPGGAVVVDAPGSVPVGGVSAAGRRTGARCVEPGRDADTGRAAGGERMGRGVRTGRSARTAGRPAAGRA